MSNVGSEFRTSDSSDVTREMLDSLVARVEVQKSKLAIQLKAICADELDLLNSTGEHQGPFPPKVLLVPWKKASIAREIVRPAGDPARREKPIKAGPRVALIRSIGLGRYWLQKILDEGATAAAIAADHGCGVRMVNMTVPLAFLSPEIVSAAVAGKLPRGLSVRTLRDPPAEWSLQMSRLGLAPGTSR